jgi:hypothetical protein
MGTTGINTGYYNSYNNYYNDLQYRNQNVSAPLMINMSEIGGANTNTTLNGQVSVNQNGNGCTDGKDDGSIGFFGAIGHMLKGAWDFVKSPFCDENGDFSLSKTLKSVAIGVGIAALTCVPVIGPLVTPTLLAIGIGGGAIKAVGAAANIMTAETDAEAKAAWESLGSSATQIAVSAYGAKKYASAKAGQNVSTWDGVKQVFKEQKDAVINGWKSVKGTSFGELAHKTGIENVVNRLRPGAATEAATEGAATEGAAAAATPKKPLFNDTREWIANKYEANKDLTLGQLSRKAYDHSKNWAYDHGARNNIKGYEVPFGIAVYNHAAS